MNTVDEACRYLDEVKDLLRAKNKSYGSSIDSPVRIFSRVTDPGAAIDIRIDDKLSRIAKGTPFGEDNEMDLIGYLALRRGLMRSTGILSDDRTPEKTE